MALVLTEPFDDFTTNGWVVTGVPTIAAARRGNGASITANATNFVRYPIPVPSQVATITVGVAHRVSAITATRTILQLASDSGATLHLTVCCTDTGMIEVRRGTSTGTLLASSAAANLIVAMTWAYIEVQATLHDTTGSVVVRLNHIPVVSATNIDTKNGGTKTVFDSVMCAGPATGTTNLFDDLYLRDDAVFQGDPAPGGDIRLARVSDRALVYSASPEARLVQVSLQAVVSLVVTGVFVKVWTGAAFESAPVKVWNGSAFVDATAVKTWNGSAFV